MLASDAADLAARSAHRRRLVARHVMRKFGRLAVGVGIAAAALVLGPLAIVYVGGAVIRGVVRALVLLLDGGVWVAVAAQQGMDWWSIAGRASAVIGETLLTPGVMFALIGLELVGAAAFYVLQRLLAHEERRRDSSKEKQ